MLHYSLVETLTQDFHGFGEIGTATLRMLAETQQIELSAEAAQAAVVGPLNSLPPHPEVLRDLTELAQRLA